jgi:hypothetical protein
LVPVELVKSSVSGWSLGKIIFIRQSGSTGRFTLKLNFNDENYPTVVIESPLVTDGYSSSAN